MNHHSSIYSFFFFNDTATTEIYTLSLHDALPISRKAAPQGARHAARTHPQPRQVRRARPRAARGVYGGGDLRDGDGDRKSTRLNSSHSQISYAVFCLKKKKKKKYEHRSKEVKSTR